MEGRSLSTTALAASGAAVLVALLVLMVKVRAAAPVPDVDPDELRRATSAGRVHQPSTPPADDAPPRIPPPRRASARRASVAWSGGEAAAAAPSDVPAAAPSAAPAQAAAEAAPAGDAQAPAEIAIEYYERGEYDSARTAAVSALRLDLPPQATDKMLRIAASASCFMGEPEQARVHYDQLVPRSQRDIARRCRRMGIEF